ncbi:sodium-coupled neutral amino acid transporter 2-like [Arapaima gigas]
MEMKKGPKWKHREGEALGETGRQVSRPPRVRTSNRVVRPPGTVGLSEACGLVELQKRRCLSAVWCSFPPSGSRSPVPFSASGYSGEMSHPLDYSGSSSSSACEKQPMKCHYRSAEGRYAEADLEKQNFLHEHQLGKKKYESEYQQGSASFGVSVFNLGNAIMGSAILGLSYAMANAGIALFVILLIAVLLFSLYSVHLLLKTANEGGSRVYEQLGYKAFGLPGKLAASCSITMQNIGGEKSVSARLTFLTRVRYLLPTEWYLNGEYLVLLVSLLVILPLSLLRNLGYLGYTSGFSLLCMVFFLIVVIYKKFHIPCPLPLELDEILNGTASALSANVLQNATACTPKYFVFNSQTVYAVPILTFAFVCHPAILPMYEELKDRSRKKMQNVANVSFLAMFVMYLLAALFGYLTFGDNVEPELLHTYSKVYKFDIVLLVVRLAVLAAVTLTVPVVLFPIRNSVNQVLCASRDFSWIRHIIITVLLVSGTNALVILVPTIRDIFGIIGASAAAMLIFILPSAFYIRLVKKEPMHSFQKIGATLFLCTGFLVMIGSMTLIVLDWTRNSSGGH